MKSGFSSMSSMTFSTSPAINSQLSSPLSSAFTRAAPEDSVYRELVLVKVKVDPKNRLETRQGVEFLANNFRAKIIDVGAENLIVEFTGNHSKVNALIQRFTEEYEVLELARTGITGLGRS